MLFHKSEIYKESVLKFIIQWNVGYFQEGFNFNTNEVPWISISMKLWNYSTIVSIVRIIAPWYFQMLSLAEEIFEVYSEPIQISSSTLGVWLGSDYASGLDLLQEKVMGTVISFFSCRCSGL